MKVSRNHNMIFDKSVPIEKEINDTYKKQIIKFNNEILCKLAPKKKRY